jgi:hypothetical protein
VERDSVGATALSVGAAVTAGDDDGVSGGVAVGEDRQPVSSRAMAQPPAPAITFLRCLPIWNSRGGYLIFIFTKKLELIARA